MTEHVTDEHQLDTSDRRLYSHEDCGLACSLSMALDAGAPPGDTVASMETWYTQHGDSPADGTGLAVNAAWLQSRGLPAETFTGGMDVVDGLLDQGFRVMLAIYSNSYGTPYSGPGNVGHFIELCWRDAGSYHVMQPVGGVEVSYTRQQLADNSQDCGVVVKHDYRQPPVTPVTGSTSGGTHLMDAQAVAAVVKLAYIEAQLARSAMGKGFNAAVLQQDVIDQAGFNGWVQKVVTGQEDLHGVVNDIVRIITSQ